ncbi:MAG TPA: enoyl-CoA hydratase/isomerase family protein [Beijerinckiaceae bacterium]|nr:enoyl-CoA hydratase/isomerase family protein [Beijerinckiaceae bacterium]
MSNAILDRMEGDILHITLNEPDSGNAMSNDMAGRLAALLEEAAERARVVVLRAAGNDFCVGRASMGKPRDTRPEALALRSTNDVVFRCYGAFRRSPVPIIAVVQGKALGFGCALAAAADITIAADDASFQLPEFGHNIMPTMARSALLGRVSEKALMYRAYSTATLDAPRALQVGIVSEVAPAAGLDQALERLCATLLKAPPPAVLAIKEFARTASAMNIEHAIQYARSLHATVNSSSEMRREKQ